MMFVMMYGFNAQAERQTSLGRMDMGIELSDKIYLFEFKLNKPAAEALFQIHEKKYFTVYLSKNKPIFLVVMSFDYHHKQISEILVEDLETKKVEKIYQEGLEKSFKQSI